MILQAGRLRYLRQGNRGVYNIRGETNGTAVLFRFGWRGRLTGT